jgi:hypothetical protein
MTLWVRGRYCPPEVGCQTYALPFLHIDTSSKCVNQVRKGKVLDNTKRAQNVNATAKGAPKTFRKAWSQQVWSRYPYFWLWVNFGACFGSRLEVLLGVRWV